MLYIQENIVTEGTQTAWYEHRICEDSRLIKQKITAEEFRIANKFTLAKQAEERKTIEEEKQR